ncbi:glycosyltransferase family 4 protein [Methanothermobacter sp. KEPCO-1]|uniref:glycosyltransferase family 4 protein n=1 Tax=Methanothermobacter TaxID=145260 RepID=UPI0011CBC8D6|nr:MULTISPECIES: glycosyltransferase family 4 protein [unclassified Methanothermobacter]QEF93777.1 glycosyltransferase family 4 protein [Methanothermobacter sp. KEPCO-1]
MRVINVVMQNYIGGPQVRVVSVAEKLLARGVETVVCAPSGHDNPLEEYVRTHGLEFEGFFMPGLREFRGFGDVIKNLIWVLSVPLTVIQMIMIIRRTRADVVHVNGVLNFQAAVAGFICRRKVVWHLMSSLYPPVVLGIMMPIVRFIADEIVVIAEGLATYYLSEGDRYTVIYEPVDLERFRPSLYSDRRDHIRESIGLSPSDTVAVCIANINPIKGYEYLLKAVPSVLKSVRDFRLLVVGDVPESQGEYYRKLREMVSSLEIKDAVKFLGRREDIPELLAASDIFVLPSIAEGTPISILEAMAMGKPVIATDVGAVDEQVIEGENGFLVSPASQDQLAERIIELSLNQDLRASMGRASRRLVEKFSLERCVEEHMRIYES